jgi:putative cofactor-binding repeat protein
VSDRDAPGLPEVLAALAEMLGGLDERETPGGAEYLRAGAAFAAVAGNVVDVRLDGPIAAAAQRTPDVGPSPRGAGWIRFRPATLDRFALDRATAWFEAAWKRAEATPTPRARPN